jgi:uncharacterized protein YicC (UPF0701 family)
MKRTFLISTLALLLAAPTLGLGAPDEAQRALTQRMQQAKRALDSAQAAEGAARDKLMQDHMGLMNEAMRQMQAARPGPDATPQQMREWIDEHAKLMDRMMSQMMARQHMMMRGSRK